MVQGDDNAVYAVIELLFTYGKLMQRTTMAEWGSLELTVAQLKMLFTLASEGKVTVGKLSGILGIGHPTASHLVDRLEQARLARRGECATDRRSSLVSLTEEGEMLARRLRQGRQDRLYSSLVQLNEPDIAALQQGLAALIRVFQTDTEMPSTCSPPSIMSLCDREEDEKKVLP